MASTGLASAALVACRPMASKATIRAMNAERPKSPRHPQSQAGDIDENGDSLSPDVTEGDLPVVHFTRKNGCGDCQCIHGRAPFLYLRGCVFSSLENL